MIYSHLHYPQKKESVRERKRYRVSEWVSERKENEKKQKQSFAYEISFFIFWKTKHYENDLLLFDCECVCVRIFLLFSFYRIHFIASITFFRSFCLELDFVCWLLIVDCCCLNFLLFVIFIHIKLRQQKTANIPDWNGGGVEECDENMTFREFLFIFHSYRRLIFFLK